MPSMTGCSEIASLESPQIEPTAQRGRGRPRKRALAAGNDGICLIVMLAIDTEHASYIPGRTTEPVPAESFGALPPPRHCAPQ